MTLVADPVSGVDGDGRDQPDVVYAAQIEQRILTVGVIGLGYAGLPLALGFAHAGFQVLGVDIDPSRVESLRRGRSYIDGITDADVKTVNGMRVSTDSDELRHADVMVVCVPTPLADESLPDLAALDDAVAHVAPHARNGRLVIIQSTVPPGTTAERVAGQIERATGYRAGVDYHLAHAPERVNPGDERWGLTNTPRVVAGFTARCAARAKLLFTTVCEDVIVVDGLHVAELAKLFENTFRLVNIALANELADACRRFDATPQEVIGAAATKPYGFLAHWPGPGAGGDCIPVDPIFLVRAAEAKGQPMPLVALAHSMVADRPARVVASIRAALGPLSGRRVLVLGAAYKPDIADTRNSPGVQVLRLLRERGAHAAYCDPFVSSLVLSGETLSSRPWSAEELATYDCAVLITPHRCFTDPAVWRACPLVLDTRGCLPETASVRQV